MNRFLASFAHVLTLSFIVAGAPISWSAPPSIAGTVRNSTGQALSSAYVVAYRGGAYQTYAYTDGSGSYSFSSLPEGTYTLRVSHSPYLGQYYGGSVFEDGATQLALGATTELSGIDVVLPDGDWVQGHVYDDHGQPLASAAVYAQAVGNDPYFYWYPYAYTDTSGYYRIYGLPAGSCVLQAESAPHLPLYYGDAYKVEDASVLALSGGSHLSGVDFHLPLGARFQVAVYDKNDGLPLHDPGQSVLTDWIVNALISDPTGPVWVGTDGGVTGFVSGATMGLHAWNAGLPNAPVRALARSSDGSLYVGTDNGLAVYRTWGTTIYTTTNSALPHNQVTALAASATGPVWIGLANGTLARLSAGTFTSWTAATRGLPGPSPITCLAIDPAGVVWMGCADGAQRYAGGASFPRTTTSNSALPSNAVQAIACATDGYQWIGTDSGLLRTNLSSEMVFHSGSGLPTSDVRSISPAHHRDVWVGTSYGMARILNEAVTATYTTGNSSFHQGAVNAVLARGAIYAGGGSGLDIFQNGVFIQIPAPQRYVQVRAQMVAPEFQNFYNGVYSTILGEVNSLPGGEYQVQVTSADYAEQWYAMKPSVAQADVLSVALGETYPQVLVFAMEMAGSISGTVQDASGNPITFGTARAVPAGDDSLSYAGGIGGGGAYFIDGVPPGDYYVYAQVSGYPPGFYGGGFNRSAASTVHVTSGQDTPNVDIVVTQNFQNGSVAGRVLDAMGHPFVNVSVSIQGRDGTVHSGYATTDGAGAYKFTSVPPGTHRIYAELNSRPTLYYPGTYRSSQAGHVDVNSGQHRVGVDLVAPDSPRATVEGVVTSGGGQPVAGAAVMLAAGVTYQAVTSATGFYRISNAWPSDDYYFLVTHPDYLPHSQDFALAPGQTLTRNVNLGAAIPAETKLLGIVRDASGNRLWSAQIYATVNNSINLPAVYTEWDGYYEYDPIAPAPTTLSVYHSNLVSQHIDLTPLAGATTIRDITLAYNLAGYGAIWGHVYDASGRPQPGLQVRLSGAGSRNVYTNEDGVYVAAGLSPGTWTVEVTSLGQPYPKVTGIVVASGLVLGDVDVTVPIPLGQIRGTVRSQGGVPLPNPVADENPINHSKTAAYRYSDSRGRYALCGLRAGLYRVSAAAEGYARQYYDHAETSDAATLLFVGQSQVLTGIDFSLPDAVWVRGRVTTAWGEPLADVNLEANSPDLQRWLGDAWTDTQGYYNLYVQEAGDFVVSAQYDGYAFQYYNQRPVFDAPDVLSATYGAVVEPVDFMLARSCVISGTVVNASNEPYNCGYVYVYNLSNLEDSWFANSIDSQGRFTVWGMPPGVYALRANVCGKTPVFLAGAYNVADASLLTLNEGDILSGVRIEVPEAVASASISGRITRAGGAPVAYAFVQLYGVDGTSYNSGTSAGSDGRYSFSSLPPGVYAVAYVRDDQPPYYYGATYSQAAATRVALGPGENAENIDIEESAFTDFAMLSGVVRDDLGQPLEGAQVSLYDTWYNHTAYSRPDGGFAFYDLHPALGSLVLFAQKAGYREAMVSGIAPTPNTSLVQDVTLVQLTGFGVSGTVYNASGSPLSGALVQVTGIDNAHAFLTYSDPFGVYALGPVPAGLYRLQASLSGYDNALLDWQNITADRQWNPVLATPAAAGAVAGVVTDASGWPAYGITVRSQGPTTRQTTTDDLGRYLLPNLSAGSYRIYLSQEADSGYPEQNGVPVVVGQLTDGVDFTVGVHYGTISGRIADATGMGIQSAQISTTPVGHNWYPPTVYSGLEGHFKVGRARAGAERNYRLYANLAGYVPVYYVDSLTSSGAAVVSLPASTDVSGIDFALQAGATVAGRVVDRLGRGVYGTSLSFYRREEPRVILYAGSDSQGDYRVTTLPPGSYEVYASHSSYVDEYYDDKLAAADADLVVVAAGERRDDIDFMLIRGGALAGQVVDASGNPVTSGTVYALSADPNTPYEVSTSLNNQGEWSFAALPPVAYYLYAKVSGRPVIFYPANYSRNSATIVSVSDEQSVSGLVITVPTESVPGGTIAGRVFRPDHFPYPNLSVRIYGADGTTGSYSYTTNTSGEYLSSALPAGSYIVGAIVSNQAPYYHGGTYSAAAATRVEVAPDSSVAGVDVTLPAVNHARLSGTVRDNHGRPVPQAVVYAYSQDGWSSYSANSDGDGLWHIEMVFPSGEYSVYAQKASYLTSPSLIVDVTPGADIAGLDLVLVGFAPAMVRGQVNSPNGTPIYNAYVSAVLAGGGFNTYAYTDLYGSFVMRDLPPGSYTFATGPSGYSSLSLPGVMIAPGTGNEVILTPQYATGGIVSGRVRDASGAPAVHVYVRTGNGTTRTTYTDGAGRYTLGGVSTNTTIIRLSDEPGTPEVTGITVADGSHTAGINFDLATTYGTIEGDVYDATGELIRGLLSIRGEPVSGGSNTESVPSGSDGHYLIGRVPVGAGKTYRVRASGAPYPTRYYADGYVAREALPVGMEPGDHRAGIDFVMVDGAALHGRVRDGDGDPLEAVSVRARWFYGPDVTNFNGTTDNNGDYRITGLPPGEYTLRFMHSEHLTEYYNNVFQESLATRIPVATGETQRLDAQLTRGGSIAGTVRNTTGDLVGAGDVSVERVSDGLDFYATVEPNGTYRVPGLPGGHYVVYLSSLGYVPQYYNGATTWEAAARIAVVTGQATAGVDFVLITESSISGHVRKGIGDPVTSGTVRAYRSDGTFVTSTSLSAQGAYTLRGLAAGSYRVRVSASGYLDHYWQYSATLAGATDIVVPTATALTGYDFILLSGGTLSGTVKNENGDPYPSGTVYLAQTWSPLSDLRSTSLTSSGEFTFSAVWPDTYYVYTSLSGKPRIYYPSSYSVGAASPVLVNEGAATTGIHIVAPSSIASGTVAGTVKFADGTPVSDNVPNIGVDGYSGTHSTNTDVYTGAFLRSGITPGTYIVRVNRSNTPSYYHHGTFVSGQATRLVLLPNQSLDNVAVVFPDEPAMETGLRRGRGSGQPADRRRARVVVAQSNAYLEVPSQPDGVYLPSVYPAQGYTLGAYLDAQVDAPLQLVNVAPGQAVSGRVLTMTRYAIGALAGWITGPAGTPIGNTSVNLQIQGTSQYFYATTHLDGYYFFATVPAVPCRITCYPSGYAGLDVSGLTVPAGGTLVRNFNLAYAAGGVVAGTVRDASNLPVAGVRVLSTNGTGRTGYTGVDGRYALAGLSAGSDYRIYLPDEPGVPEATGVAVVADATTAGVDFALSVPYGRITGAVRDATGQPLGNVEVDGTSLSGTPKPADASSRHDGSYSMLRVRRDAGAQYRLFARDGVHVRQYWNHVLTQAAASPVSIPGSGLLSGIDFDLAPGASLEGRVIDATGAPLAYADLRADHAGDLGQFTTSADLAGFFTLAALPAGQYTLRAQKAGYRVEYWDDQVRAADATLISLSTGESRDGFAVTLDDGGFIAGTVRNTTGEPLFYANVYTQNPQNTEGSSSAFSNLAGGYRLTGLPADRYRVRASRNGYLDAMVDHVNVTEGQTTALDLVMFAVGQPTWTPTPTPTGSTTPTYTPTATRTPTPTMTNTPTVTNTPRPLDIRPDGQVNALDVLEFCRNWNAVPGGPSDLNGDGIVDGADLLIFLETWESR
ncbi:carboxypeptidase regulatory-like domain-containing protein [bacterium]|nr:carboxypeptidase regulatory-like domain-containing protein [bacterium]